MRYTTSGVGDAGLAILLGLLVGLFAASALNRPVDSTRKFSGAGSTSSYSETQPQTLMLDMVNAERTKAGVSTLRADTRLVASSGVKAKDLVTNHYWAHDRPDGERFSVPIFKEVPNSPHVGENLAKCFGTTEEAFAGLVASPEHYKDIVDAKYTMYGDSSDTDSEGCVYIVQHFAE